MTKAIHNLWVRWILFFISSPFFGKFCLPLFHQGNNYNKEKVKTSEWYSFSPYPNSQLTNQKPTLLSWYPTISSHWPDSATVTLNFGLNLGTVIPNRVFLVRFGGISGSFDLAMGILAWLRLAEIRTMGRPNWPDMPPKRTKKVRLGILIEVLRWTVVT